MALARCFSDTIGVYFSVAFLNGYVFSEENTPMHHGGVLPILPIRKCLILLASVLHVIDSIEQIRFAARLLFLFFARLRLCKLAQIA